MTIICTVDSPIGWITIRTENNHLAEVDFFATRKPSAATKASDSFINKICKQFARYFSDAHSGFDVAYQLEGTDFQKSVWQALLKIPPGQVMTYGELARKLNTSPRAVGNACRANPLPIFVPCHRVISQAGIGGYAGKTGGKQLEVKRWLLLHEGAMVNGL